MSDVKQIVRERYAKAALQMIPTPASNAACCSTDCCGATTNAAEATDTAVPAGTCGTGYVARELSEAGLDTSISLGCGNPTLLAQLAPGETVLDLGSGGGLDVLLSARRVGPDGHAYGVDMTDEMLSLAHANKEKAGVANATFLKGTIENVPLPSDAVDVVISNCVINLAEDKRAVLHEAFRVLRPGGRLAVADMVELETLSPEVKKAADAWAGCVAGTIPVSDYRALLDHAGFVDSEIEIHQLHEVPAGGKIGSAYIRARKPKWLLTL
jgi:SAM-dependent methyltransferase